MRASRRRAVHWFGFAATTAAIVINRLVGTPIGLLALAIGFYWFSASLWDVHPYGVRELFEWVARQPIEAVMAVVGFLLAYSTALAAWRRQKFTELALTTAGEVEAFLGAVGRDLRGLVLYVERLVELREGLLAKDAKVDEFSLRNAAQLAGEANAQRARIAVACVEVYDVRARHMLMLDRSMFTSMAFDRIEAAFEAITGVSVFLLPLPSWGPEKLAFALANTAPDEWVRFARVADQKARALAACSGAITGYFRARIIPPSLWSVVRHFKNVRSATRG